ncbi:uncharacterized protein [Euwallacea fornicatus]|uniref:uncharacterized protein n=1 Tax=Euwallacea fornicatus TaxID=995702 RepID=UPI00338D9587
MDSNFWLILIICLLKCATTCCDGSDGAKDRIDRDHREMVKAEAMDKRVQSWQGALSMYPTVATWSLHTSIPFSSESSPATDLDEDLDDEGSGRGKKGGLKKKMKKYMMPLLIAYKLKFFTLIPVMIGGLILLTGATGLAGFFFALFAAVMGLKSGHN